VVGADGKPVAGAKLYLTLSMGYLKHPEPSPEFATTGSDGTFEFTAPWYTFGDRFNVVAATAPGHAAGWVEVARTVRKDALTIRLASDDTPITGQVVDLEGKPVPGATLRVLQINAAPNEDLGAFLEAARAKSARSLAIEQKHLSRMTVALAPTVKTDAAGRFRLDGIGRDRLVLAQIDGPTIASTQVRILTRPGKPFDVIYSEARHDGREPAVISTYYGADFRHAAAPSKPIVGVVRDKDTNKPLAGVTIQSEKIGHNPYHGEEFINTTTDAQGRYRLTGMPKGTGSIIMAVPSDDQPYFSSGAAVPDTEGLDAVAVDFELKHGIWVEGKVTDQVTGKPIPGGSLEYYATADNPHLKDCPNFTRPAFRGTPIREDGTYRALGLPGPGLIAVFPPRGHYLRAPDRDGEFGTKLQSLETAPFIISFTSNYVAIARIDPPAGTDPAKRDVTLDPGWSFTGKLLDPDGKPLAGAKGYGVSWDVTSADDGTRSTADFVVQGFNPHQPRDVFFRHAEKGLVGVFAAPKENGGKVEVRMEPGAAAAGRLLDADGKPRAGVELELVYRKKGGRYWEGYFGETVTTDAEGRFRVAALLPGYEFRLNEGGGELPLGGEFEAGRTKELGDVRLKSPGR
jgi:protocatechuate 3,4-dioxygenase beta subunit